MSATPSNVTEFAAQAAEYVRRAVGVPVEYDSDTLPLVDHYLGTVPTEQQDTASLVATTTGAYFGEVVRLRLGGRWEAETDDASQWRVILPIGVSFSPAAVVLAAMLREDNADAEFYIPAVLKPYAAEALSRMGEVTEDEYYSLCGRLDTLEHLHSVLLAVAAEQTTKNEQAN